MTDQLIALAVAAIWAIGIVVTSRRISQAERRALDALEREPAGSIEEALRRHLEGR